MAELNCCLVEKYWELCYNIHTMKFSKINVELNKWKCKQCGTSKYPIFLREFVCDVDTDDDGVLYVSRFDGKTTEYLICTECKHKVEVSGNFIITGSGTICLKKKK